MGGEVVKPLGTVASLVRETVNPANIENTPYIGLEHIEENSLRLSSYGWSSQTNSAKSRFRKGDILFGKLRPYFRKVIKAPFDGVCSTDIWVIRAKDGIDQGYLYYWMTSQDFVDAVSKASEGTKMPRASWEYASNLQKVIPPLAEQRRIAHILGTLDDKIELNRRMNATLEAMARALFKSWFVDFDPVHAKAAGRPSGLPPELDAQFPDSFVDSELGPIPKGWEVGSITQVAKVLSGGTPSTKKLEYWNGDIPWVSAKDVNNSLLRFVLKTERTVSALGIENSSAKILPAKTTIITARGTVGNICLLGSEMTMNQTNYGLAAKNEFGNYLVFFMVANLIAALKMASYGTIFDTITTPTLETTRLVLPNLPVCQVFEEIVSPFMDRIRINQIEDLSLSSARDTLVANMLAGH